MTQQPVNDHELIARIAHGDRQAFEMLYERYAGLAFGLAMRMLQDCTAGEDVVQEAFCRVWQRAAHFKARGRAEGGNVRAWLLTIVHRLAIDAQRKHKPELDLDVHDDVAWDLEDHDGDVFEHVFTNIETDRVRAAIAQLSEHHRAVIELAFFWGLTHREIAERLGEPLGTVHSWAAQGMNRLKALLKQPVN